MNKQNKISFLNLRNIIVILKTQLKKGYAQYSSHPRSPEHKLRWESRWARAAGRRTVFGFSSARVRLDSAHFIWGMGLSTNDSDLLIDETQFLFLNSFLMLKCVVLNRWVLCPPPCVLMRRIVDIFGGFGHFLGRWRAVDVEVGLDAQHSSIRIIIVAVYAPW